jgi:hypothetical protein
VRIDTEGLAIDEVVARIVEQMEELR